MSQDREKLVEVVRDWVVNAQACLDDFETGEYDKLAQALVEAALALDEIYTIDCRGDSRFRYARQHLIRRTMEGPPA